MAHSLLILFLSVCWVLVNSAPSFNENRIVVDDKRSATVRPSNVQDTAATMSPDVPQSAVLTSGYPQLFTRKTTSLLAEALHMLSRVKDVKERRWLETFVHRLASLADDLDRSSGQGHAKQPSKVERVKGLADFSKSLAENAGQLQQMVSQHLENSKTEEQASDGSELVQQLHQGHPAQLKQMLKTNKTPVGEEDENAKHRESKLKMEKIKEFEKTKLLKNIFAEVQKLRELGGKPQDVLEILKRNRVIAGARKDLTEQAASQQQQQLPPSTLAPTSGQLREAVTEGQVSRTTAVVGQRQQGNEDEEDEDQTDQGSDEVANDDVDDDLVKQLEEEKLILVSTPGEEDEEGEARTNGDQ